MICACANHKRGGGAVYLFFIGERVLCELPMLPDNLARKRNLSGERVEGEGIWYRERGPCR